MATGGSTTLTNENRNYVRVVYLMTDVGTSAVREIFDQLPIFAPKDLTKNLNSNRKSPEMKAVPAFLTKILFPSEDASKIWKSTDFDLTMMVTLLEKLHTPLPVDVVSWDATKDLIKVIKENRNRHAHSKDPKISDADFQTMWNDVSQAILDLVNPASKPKYQQKMQDIKVIPIGNEEFLKVIQLVKDDFHRLQDILQKTQKLQQKTQKLQQKTMNDVKLGQKYVKKKHTQIKTKVDRIQGDLEKLKEDQASTSKEQGAYFGGYKKKYFTGREKELTKLETLFAVNEARERVFCGVSICGTGGYGKTALAAEYAHRHEDFYVGGIIWIACDNFKLFSQRINEVTLRLDLDGTSVEDKVSLMTDWLIKRKDPILLIADNVDEGLLPKPVQTLISGSWRDKFKGHMLITTRKQASDVCSGFCLEEDCCIQLQTLRADDAVNFLFHQSQLSQTDGDVQRGAELVCKDLGNLPLAIEQSGSYIKKMISDRDGSLFSQYHQIFETRKAKLIGKLSKHGNRFKATPTADEYSQDRLAIQTTWIVNFEHIKNSSKAAAYVMLILSFFGVSDIPCCLLNANPEHLMNSDLKEAIKESQDMGLQGNEIQDYLTEFSLFYHNKENDTLSVHPLIQFMMREEALNSEVNDIFHDGINLLGGAFKNLKVLPRDILKSRKRGVSIYNMPSIYHWGQLAHHSDVFISHILQQQESEVYQQTEKTENLLQTFYSHSMSKVLYEVATYLSINGSNKKAIMYRNMAIKVASFWNVTLPFENLRAISEIPLTFPTTAELKTCLLSKAEKDEIGKIKRGQDFSSLEKDNYLPLPRFQGDPCSIASKCRNHVLNMNKLEDSFFLLARSRCNAALACSDIQQTHDTGCKCSDILVEKTIEISSGQTIQVSCCIHKQDEKRQNPEDFQIIVLKKGIYDLSKYAKPSVKNTHFIGVNKDECIFVTPGTSQIFLCGTVHFENFTLNCSDSLIASPRSIVSFSNCKFQSAEKVSDDVVNTISEKNGEFPNMLLGYNSTIFILDSQASVQGGFLYAEDVKLTIQRTDILGNHCGRGITSKDGRYLNLYEVDIESFECGLDASFLPLGKCHIRLSKFYHQSNVGVAIMGPQEGQEEINAELILRRNIVTDNGGFGARIEGNFSVLIEYNDFSRNAGIGLTLSVSKQRYGRICENNVTKYGFGLMLDYKSDIELVGNTFDGKPFVLFSSLMDSKVTLNELLWCMEVDKDLLGSKTCGVLKEKVGYLTHIIDPSYHESHENSLTFRGLDANKGPKHVLRFFLKKVGYQWTALSQEEQTRMKSVSAAYCRYQLANRDGVQLPLCTPGISPTYMIAFLNYLLSDFCDNTLINALWFIMQVDTNITFTVPNRFFERLLYELFPITEKLAALGKSLKNKLYDGCLQSNFDKDPLNENKELAQLCPNCLKVLGETHLFRCESCRVIRYCSTLCRSYHCKKHQNNCIKIQQKYTVAVDITRDLNLKILQSNQAVPVDCWLSEHGVDTFNLRPSEEPHLEVKIQSERMRNIITALSDSIVDRLLIGVTLPARLTEDGNKLLIYITDTFCINHISRGMMVMNRMFQKIKKPLEFLEIELD